MTSDAEIDASCDNQSQRERPQTCAHFGYAEIRMSSASSSSNPSTFSTVCAFTNVLGEGSSIFAEIDKPRRHHSVQKQMRIFLPISWELVPKSLQTCMSQTVRRQTFTPNFPTKHQLTSWLVRKLNSGGGCHMLASHGEPRFSSLQTDQSVPMPYSRAKRLRQMLARRIFCLKFRHHA